ncbi:Transmembrane protein 87A [Gryllus bimaculatus]|nr:Transmembrane protein 87A [Gryllus bimaculatus]
MSFVSVNFICIFVIFLISECALSFPEAGKWEQTYYMSNVSASKEIRFPKSLYAGSEIYITVGCAPQHNEDRSIDVSWSINDLMCWNDYILTNDEPDVGNVLRKPGGSTNKKCGPQISLDRIPSEVLSETPKPLDEYQSKKANKRAASSENTISTNNTSVPTPQIDENRPKNPKKGIHSVYTVPVDGLYVLDVRIVGENMNVTMEVKMVGHHGYLSAVDWPLLPFYGAMCVVYVIFGLVWLAVSFCQWRDLLRVQFWIGAVILLGMLEKATFYAEYQSLNSTGKSVRAAVLLAELVSCAKRTLARMLVIIVSLGFGIVKPRLGPTLHRVILTGTLYMLLAAVESYLRVGQVKDDSAGRQLLLASVPLAVLDRVKMRGSNRSNSPKPPKSTNTAEDDLKWVEENIPSSMPDTALPVLDSDEEIMTTKFEVSKMQ